MNKKLLAMAIAAAMAAPAAAMADATVYGKVHVAIDLVGGDSIEDLGGGAEADYGQLQVVSNSSRLGVKGSEDLGNGLTALWQYEVTANVTESGDLFGGGRNSFVGLSGGFGTLLVGRHDTPVKGVSRKYELFPEYVGDSRSILNVGAVAGYDLRTPNTIAYVLPKMGNFSAIVGYVTDHDKAGTSGTSKDDGNFDAYSLAAGYDGGMWTADLGYEVHNIEDPGVAGASDSESVLRLGAGVKFGAARVVALYQQVTDQNFVDGNDRTAYGVGASYDLGGGNVIKAQYYLADESDEGSDNGASMFALGFDHKFTKRTTVYLAYAATANDDDANSNPWGSGGNGRGNKIACETGGDCNAFSVGMIHKF